MPDLHDDLTTLAGRGKHAAKLPPAETLRVRSDRRRHRRTVIASAGLAVLAVAGGAAFLQTRSPAPPPVAAPTPPSPSATAPATILNGKRQVSIEVAGMNGAVLALGRGDDDQVKATTDTDPGDRSRWILRPRGDKYQIVLGALHGTSQVCMTTVHDKAPGTVRGRVCDPTLPTQLFILGRTADGTCSLFQDEHYIQVIDGTNALVPDLPESLTTTYELHDRGPADPAIS
ncbi:hypothetical protein GCM10010435_92480 [Winogradskya consettensis]|uniref:Uncharacterized protein n=1 Tax=Winogradskya consettensis TaxID=113560 RepID=A0A919SGC9_9ACTN|nr:hypothetical protein [Actinoplanes consettensis]GIM71164.1 hypothetical protein Aco04nite_23910 [Actinoplanes consettensis]